MNETSAEAQLTHKLSILKTKGLLENMEYLLVSEIFFKTLLNELKAEVYPERTEDGGLTFRYDHLGYDVHVRSYPYFSGTFSMPYMKLKNSH